MKNLKSILGLNLFIVLCALAALVVCGSAHAANITSTATNYSTCPGTTATVLNYKNQFKACMTNYWDGNQSSTANPQSQCNGTFQVAVGTAPSSTDIAAFQTVSCNGTIGYTITGTMFPGTTYYVTRKQSGNYENTGGFSLENTVPTITNGEPASQWYIANPGSTISVTFADNAAVCTAKYEVWSGSGKTGTNRVSLSTITNNINLTSYNINGVLAAPWASMGEGDNFFSFTVNDCAGNSASSADLFNMKKDTSLPSHTITTPAAYWTTNTTPVIQWTAADTTSGISCHTLQYKVMPSGSYTSTGCVVIAGGPGFQKSFTGVEGTTYAVKVQVQDAAGNTDSYDADNSNTFMIDTRTPTAAVTTPSAYQTATPFTVAWTGSDPSPGSGLKGYNVKYALASGGPWSNWLVGTGSTPGTTAANASFNLGSDGNTYYFQIQAIDNAGLMNSYTTNTSGTLIDLTKPSSSVAALPAYTGTSAFAVSWSGSDTSVGTASGVACYDVQYKLNSGSWTAWQSCTTSVTASFDATTHGGVGTYQFQSRAKDNAGNWELYPGAADVQTNADYTAPVISAVNDGSAADVDMWKSGTTIEANWSASEPDTSIDRYEYAIGTTSGGTDIKTWTDNGVSTSISLNTVVFTHKMTYYITVRAYNLAQIYSQMASDGFMVDLLPPTVNIISPNSAYMGTTSFTIEWSGADGTGESGIKNYDVEVKDVGFGGWSVWKSATVLTSDTYAGTNGRTYQIRVIARDNADNASAYPANPDYHVQTIVDTSNLPSPATISEGAVTGSDLDYSQNAASFSANWSSVTGAKSYAYAFGTTAGGTDIINWTEITGTSFTATGLTLVNGTTYYLSVKAKNFSDIFGFTGTGDGYTVDQVPPSCSVSALAAYQSSADFTVQWGETGGPDISGIAQYQIQYRDGLAGLWTDWQSGTLLTSANFPGNNSHTYYFQCRAVDTAGNQGAYPGADGQATTSVDTSVLQPPATLVDGSGPADIEYTTDNTSLTGTWSAVTGAASYVICFGNGLTPSNCNVMAWTNVGSVLTYTLSSLSLTEEETYFMRIKVKNFSGTEGPIGYTDGVTLNAAAPGTPVVTDEGTETNITSQMFAFWTATPGISGIAEYQYAIGTSQGGTDVVNWTSTGTTREITKTGLTLANGSTYYFSVKAKSGAGVWSAEGYSDGMLVDTQGPVCSIQPLTAYQTSLTFPLAWSATDAGSGIANLYDVKYRDGAAGNWVTWKSFSSLTTSNFTGIESHTYYFQCRALDKAGNWGSYPGADGDTQTIVNASLTSGPTVNDGTGADEDFTSSATALSANWTVPAGAVAYAYAIGTTSGGTDLLGWTDTASTSFSQTALSLANGATYYVSVKAKNSAGTFGAVSTSDGIKVDSDPPTTPVVVPPDTVTSSISFLETTWSSSEPQTAIVEYQVSVGTTPGGVDVKNWYSAALDTSAVISGITLTHGTTYYINVKASNKSGLWSAVGSSPGILVNTTLIAPPATINDGTGDDIDYTSSPDTISGNWISVAGAASYEYAIGTVVGSRNVVDWTSSGTSTSFTHSGLTLSDGTIYYVMIRCRNSADVAGSSRNSDGVMSDATPPGTPVVTDSGDYSTDNTTLAASWTSTPGASGINEYLYSIGTAAGATDIQDWTSSGVNTSATITGLSLAQGGPYYISVKAVGNSGLESVVGSADGVTVDSISPTCAVQSLDPFQANSSFTVAWSGVDTGVGITSYDVQSRDGQNGLWMNWLTATTLTSSTFTAQDGHQYFYRCTAKDAVGNKTAHATEAEDTFTSYTTFVPAAPTLSDGGSTDIDYLTSSSAFSFSWTGDSTADAYYYALGTTPGGTDVINWTEVTPDTLSVSLTGLSLMNNQMYYATVKYRAFSYNYSTPGVSDGVLVDLQPPTTPIISRPSEYVSSLTTLSASWSATDGESGIVDYQVSIGTSPGGTNTKDWTSVGLVTFASISGLSLADGTTYYINVKASDNAGYTGSVGSSAGVTVDSTLLAAPETITDGNGAEDIDFSSDLASFHASWTAVPEVESYEYSLGTTAGAMDVAAWKSSGNETTASITGLSLEAGKTYYINVRAVNFAGIKGEIGSSDGVTVDPTAPSTPVVVDDGAKTTAGGPLHFTMNSTEDYTLITGYEYAIGSEQGKTDIKPWTSAGKSTEITDTEVALTLGDVYFISARATNQAGSVSEEGYSDGIKAVLEPMISVTTEDGVPVSGDGSGSIKPALITLPPDMGSDLTVSKRLKFRESNGVSVTYDKISRRYILESGQVFDDPETDILLEIAGGAETKVNFELYVPERVLMIALGGAASAIIILEYNYTGTDQSSGRVETTIMIPIKVTTAMNEAAFEVMSSVVNYPADGDKLARGKENTAVVTIKLNGVGTVSGVWLLDDSFYKAFSKDVLGETEITAKQLLPPALTGEHTLQFRITEPEVLDSPVVTFKVSDPADDVAKTVDDFWIGFVNLKVAKVTYDPVTQTWSGSAKFNLPFLEDELQVDFKRLLIEQENDENVVKRGIIAVTLDKTLEKGPLKINLTKLFIGSDQVAMDCNITFTGGGDLPEMGPFYFYAVGITKNSIEGTVKLSAPQKGKIGNFELGISQVYFSVTDSGMALKTAGYLTTTPTSIFTVHIYLGVTPDGVSFDYSVEEKDDWIVPIASSSK